MTRFRNDLTADYVRGLLFYDPETGILTWKVNRAPRGKIGQEAGTINSNGSRSIGIGGKLYYAHRLAWLIVTGDWPPEQIDHKHWNPQDNRWETIRAATHSENLFNQRVSKSNKCGVKGIYKRADCNRWAAFIQKNKKTYYLGLFKTQAEAAAAYQAAAIRLHGKFAHHAICGGPS